MIGRFVPLYFQTMFALGAPPTTGCSDTARYNFNTRENKNSPDEERRVRCSQAQRRYCDEKKEEQLHQQPRAKDTYNIFLCLPNTVFFLYSDFVFFGW